MKGHIKFFKTKDGYGFIIGEDTKEYFFSKKDIVNLVKLTIGDEVQFRPSTNTKGLRAEVIVKIE